MSASVINNRDKRNFDYVDHFNANGKITQELMNELWGFIPPLEKRRKKAVTWKRAALLKEYNKLLKAKKIALELGRNSVRLDRAIDDIEDKLF